MVIALVKELTGEKFNNLTVINRVGTNNNGNATWLCKCDCGNMVIADGHRLRRGHTNICSCYKRGQLGGSITHGLTRRTSTLLEKKIANVHAGMMQRCYNEKIQQYNNYGGRGITVCDEWKNISVFAKWALSSGVSNKLTLDRIDVDGNYEPGNCRWATQKVQQNNRTNNTLLTYKGKTMTLAQWSDETGIKVTTICSRFKLGWSVEMALGTEPQRRKRR